MSLKFVLYNVYPRLMKTCPLDKISTEKNPFSMVVEWWSKLDTDGQSIASQSAGAGQSPGSGRISKVGPKSLSVVATGW